MSDRRDAIYTPRSIATQLAAAMPGDLVGKVLDPTAGEGALLDSVVERFGSSVTPLAIDISPSSVASLAARGWTASAADALSPRSRAGSTAWRGAKQDLAAVVLNPPFSYRGNGGRFLHFGDFSGRVAPAVEFLAVVLRELDPKHGIWAILPEGATRADKHARFWEEVQRLFVVEEIAVFGQKTFPGAHVTTSLLHLRRRDTPVALSDHTGALTPIVPTEHCMCVEVVRGRVPVHSIHGTSEAYTAPFLHTTDFGPRRPLTSRLGPLELSDQAPLIVIPRVGKWSGPHLVEVGRVVLSDCLIGFRSTRPDNLGALFESLDSAADAFRARYKGTGAKYLTLDSATSVLSTLGWKPVVTRASRPPLLCDCAGEGAGVRRVNHRNVSP